jgi:hypothetical protein
MLEQAEGGHIVNGSSMAGRTQFQSSSVNSQTRARLTRTYRR